MFGLRSQELFFVALLLVITVMTSMDLVADYAEGTDTWHLLVEFAVVVVSIFGIALLLREFIRRRRDLEEVSKQLKQTHANLSASREQVRAAGQEYMQVIQRQFDDWQFTPSEKEVAALLLKGLSFDEIASVRSTKEKTVRQQATGIYRKAGLNGRHEFAAWFFEDFLQ